MNWFRSRANLSRTNEEVNLIIAEAKALRRGFSFASAEWARRAEASEAYRSPGAKSYALEQSDMFKDMGDKCALHLKTAWEDHHARMADDGERQGVYDCTQKDKLLSENCIAYDVVST